MMQPITEPTRVQLAAFVCGVGIDTYIATQINTKINIPVIITKAHLHIFNGCIVYHKPMTVCRCKIEAVL